MPKHRDKRSSSDKSRKSGKPAKIRRVELDIPLPAEGNPNSSKEDRAKNQAHSVDSMLKTSLELQNNGSSSAIDSILGSSDNIVDKLFEDYLANKSHGVSEERKDPMEEINRLLDAEVSKRRNKCKAVSRRKLRQGAK